MVGMVLTYALDAHVLTHTQLQRIESAQTVMIRRASRAPAHIDKENNTKLRTRTNVHSLTSTLAHRRILNLHKALLFPHDSIAYLTALFGQTELDNMRIPTQYTSSRLKQLATDLNNLKATLANATHAPQHHAHTGIVLNSETMNWLSHLTKDQIAKILQRESSAEKWNNIKATAANEPIYKCTECTAAYD